MKTKLFEVNGVVQKFVWIEPGTFLMGSPQKEEGHCEDEIQHEVTLTKGYWLADTTCTQALWQVVMGDNPSYFTGKPDNPVERVSWYDVQTFLQNLNTMVPNLGADLPTEAQWEYACRAGTLGPFSFGQNISLEQVNYDGNLPYTRIKKGLSREKPVPVASLPPNPWGLYEMHGNVWEWCADWYGDYPREPQIDPSGPSEGRQRVMRGGSWFSYVQYCCSAYRGYNPPDVRNGIIGFRIKLSE